MSVEGAGSDGRLDPRHPRPRRRQPERVRRLPQRHDQPREQMGTRRQTPQRRRQEAAVDREGEGVGGVGVSEGVRARDPASSDHSLAPLSLATLSPKRGTSAMSTKRWVPMPPRHACTCTKHASTYQANRTKFRRSLVQKRMRNRYCPRCDFTPNGTVQCSARSRCDRADYPR